MQALTFKSKTAYPPAQPSVVFGEKSRKTTLLADPDRLEGALT
jgi:hypothetical protein